MQIDNLDPGHHAQEFGTGLDHALEPLAARRAELEASLLGRSSSWPGTTAKALRTFQAGRAYENDPVLGTDPQPKHLRDKYTGTDDEGGVHINSGIPNHAFYLTAMELGGYAWERAGRIWYVTLRDALRPRSSLATAAKRTYQVAGVIFGEGSEEQKAVKTGWTGVGVKISK